MCVPKGNNDELRILRAVLDVVCNNRDIAEVERCINLVHEVKGSRFEVMESEDKSQRTQSLDKTRVSVQFIKN